MTKTGNVFWVFLSLFFLSHKFIICLHLFSYGSWKIIGIIDLIRKTVIYIYGFPVYNMNGWLCQTSLRMRKWSLLRKYLYITRVSHWFYMAEPPQQNPMVGPPIRPIHMDVPANCENAQRWSEQEKCRTTAEEPKMEFDTEIRYNGGPAPFLVHYI